MTAPLASGSYYSYCAAWHRRKLQERPLNIKRNFLSDVTLHSVLIQGVQQKAMPTKMPLLPPSFSVRLAKMRIDGGQSMRETNDAGARASSIQLQGDSGSLQSSFFDGISRILIKCPKFHKITAKNLKMSCDTLYFIRILD